MKLSDIDEMTAYLLMSGILNKHFAYYKIHQSSSYYTISVKRTDNSFQGFLLCNDIRHEAFKSKNPFSSVYIGFLEQLFDDDGIAKTDLIALDRMNGNVALAKNNSTTIEEWIIEFNLAYGCNPIDDCKLVKRIAKLIGFNMMYDAMTMKSFIMLKGDNVYDTNAFVLQPKKSYLDSGLYNNALSYDDYGSFLKMIGETESFVPNSGMTFIKNPLYGCKSREEMMISMDLMEDYDEKKES